MAINKPAITVFLLLSASALSHPALAQNGTLRGEAEVEIIEFKLSEDKGEEDLQVLSEELHQVLMNPVYINSDDISILSGCGLITEIQHFKLREYRYRYGNLLTINELQSVEGWDTQTMLRVMPFVTLNQGGYRIAMPEKTKPAFHHELMITAGRYVQKSAGYYPADTLPAAFGGDPWRYGLRYDARIGKHFLAGFRMEKDPGEQILPYHSEYQIRMNFPDFLSGYLLVKDIKFIRSICIGDYRLRFGRGISLSTGGGFSSWKDPFGMTASARKFRQNTSMAESGFFRGAEISLEMKGFSVDLFYSALTLDPSGLQSDTAGNRWFTGFSNTGYHRTSSECAARGVVTGTSYGGIADFRNRWLMAGVLYIHSTLTASRKPSGRAYASLDFNGKENMILGAFAEASFGKSFTYIETSYKPGNEAALIAGWQAVLSPDVKFSVDFRHFPTGFQAGFHASGTGPYGSLNCETGLSLGLNLGLPGRWKTGLVVDYARNPWLRYQVNGVGRKYSTHIGITRHTEVMDLYIGYTYRQGEENYSAAFRYLEPLESTTKNQVDLQLIVFQDDRFRFKSRITWLAVGNPSGETSTGFGIQEEILCCFPHTEMKMTIGAILFNSEDYASGVYMYEPDLRYSAGSHTLYEEGIRSYLILRKKICNNFDASIKVARSWYSNKRLIGSGTEQLAGSERSEIKMQIAYRM